MAMIEMTPSTIHRGLNDLPFVQLGDGSELQLLQVDLAAGVWTVRTRFAPDTTVATHRHTGHVHAFTLSGSWHYLESPDAVNIAGSYLFEPAGSVHTLHVPATNDEMTDVWFTINGANLDLDADGQITNVLDAHSILVAYRALCAAEHGLEDAPVVIIGA